MEPTEEAYQTPLWCCEYMVSLIPDDYYHILEPTPGKGNLVRTLESAGYVVVAPQRFENLEPWEQFDCVVMNPPFHKGIEYDFLFSCMRHSPNVIALMPFNTIINADRRATELLAWGLKAVSRLPRSTFRGTRLQSCILELQHGYKGPIEFKFVNNPEV